jgi:hypothetical protein
MKKVAGTSSDLLSTTATTMKERKKEFNLARILNFKVTFASAIQRELKLCLDSQYFQPQSHLLVEMDLPNSLHSQTGNSSNAG